MTLTTCGILATLASTGVIALRTAGSSMVPRALWKTIVSTSPLWALNWPPSRSTTCWASVPGRLKSVAYWRPTAPAMTVVSTATTIHPPITQRR
jgi:hypothetical protein